MGIIHSFLTNRFNKRSTTSTTPPIPIISHPYPLHPHLKTTKNTPAASTPLSQQTSNTTTPSPPPTYPSRTRRRQSYPARGDYHHLSASPPLLPVGREDEVKAGGGGMESGRKLRKVLRVEGDWEVVRIGDVGGVVENGLKHGEIRDGQGNGLEMDILGGARYISE